MATSELEKIVAEIKQGKRIVLFPPGIWHLAFTVILTMMGFVFLMGTATKIFAADKPVPVVAVAQLVSLLIPMVGVVLPGLMILRGKKWFALWLRYFIFTLALLGIVGVVYALSTRNTLQAQALLISLGFLGAAIWLSSRAKFLLLCEFFFLLKRPNEER